MGGVSAPSGYARGSFAGLDSGREQTRRITPDQGRERERTRERGKGGGRNWSAGSQKAGHAESLLASGSVSHFTSSLAVAKAQRRGQEEGGGEGGTLRQLSLSLSHTNTLSFFTKKTQLRLKLKQGKTRKSRAVSCSPSFSQFPVQGGHFVTQPGEGAQHLFGICFCLLTPTARSFSIHFGLSPLQSNFFGRER